MRAATPGRRSAAERDALWARWGRGESLGAVARALSTYPRAVRAHVAHTNGRRSAAPRRAEGALTAAEREEVSRGLAAAESCRRIAARLGRSHTTISCEVARNRGRAPYRAGDAEGTAWARARRPKPARLAGRLVLRAAVERGAGSAAAPSLPATAVPLANDLGIAGYSGVNPPPGTGTHRLLACVSALAVERLDRPEHASLAMLHIRMVPHTLGRAILVGTSSVL